MTVVYQKRGVVGKPDLADQIAVWINGTGIQGTRTKTQRHEVWEKARNRIASSWLRVSPAISLPHRKIYGKDRFYFPRPLPRNRRFSAFSDHRPRIECDFPKRRRYMFRLLMLACGTDVILFRLSKSLSCVWRRTSGDIKRTVRCRTAVFGG